MARTDPFNYILEMEMSICLKQQLGETFWMEEVLQCKGKQTRGRRILLAKLSSTKTLFKINTKGPISSWSISLEEPIGRLQRVGENMKTDEFAQNFNKLNEQLSTCCRM